MRNTRKAQRPHKQTHCIQCGNPVTLSARQSGLYLCKRHYRKHVERERRKYVSAPPVERPALQRCARENCKGYVSPGQLYCCQDCRRLASRIIDDDIVMQLNDSSWMRNIKAMLKRHPLQFASLRNGVSEAPNEELATLSQLLIAFADVEHFQYRQLIDVRDKKTGRLSRKLKAQMPVQLGHRYPAAEGGSNIRKALTLTPELINKKLNAFVFGPVTQWGETHFGQSLIMQGTSEPFEGSPLRHLLNYSSKEMIIGALRTTSHKIDQRWVQPTTLPDKPLTRMLGFELGLYGPRSCLLGMQKIQAHLPAGYEEIVAMACFVALQTQDADSMLKTLATHQTFRHHQSMTSWAFQQYVSTLKQNGSLPPGTILCGTYVYDVLIKARKAIRRCFRVDFLKKPEKMVEIYQRMFITPPSGFILQPLTMINRRNQKHPHYKNWRLPSPTD